MPSEERLDAETAENPGGTDDLDRRRGWHLVAGQRFGGSRAARGVVLVYAPRDEVKVNIRVTMRAAFDGVSSLCDHCKLTFPPLSFICLIIIITKTVPLTVSSPGPAMRWI